MHNERLHQIPINVDIQTKAKQNHLYKYHTTDQRTKNPINRNV